MEPEQYFKCPVCGRKVLKRNGIKLIGAAICEDCFDKMIYDHKEITEEKMENNFNL